MQIMKTDWVFDGASAAITNSFNKYSPDVHRVMVQVESTNGTSFTVQVGGVFESSMADVELPIIKHSDASSVTSITADGLYYIDCDGFGQIKFDLSAVTGGSVSCFMKQLA